MSTNYFSTSGPIVSEFEVSTIPSYNRHSKKHGKSHRSLSKLTQDDSIYTVDNSKSRRIKQSSSFSKGYGVPYNDTAYSNYGTSSYQYGIIESDVIYPAGSKSKSGRTHRIKKTKEADKAQPVSDKSVVEKPTSVTGEQTGASRSPLLRVDADNNSDLVSSRKKSRSSRKNRSRSGGFGHIGDNLVYIEEGSNHQPPQGYVLKGKIEVETMECGASAVPGPVERPQPLPPCPPPPCPPAPSTGGCPPGWHQVVLSSVGSSSFGFGGGFSSGLGSQGIPANGQIIADYVLDAGSSSSGGYSDGGSGNILGGGSSSGFSGGFSSAFGKTRVKLIEIWEKKSKTSRKSSSSSSSSSSSDRSRHGNNASTTTTTTTTNKTQTIKLDELRNELLKAIERLAEKKPSGGGSSGESEVRVIVQPIQPVFYMPRPTDNPQPNPPNVINPPAPNPGPGPAPVQPGRAPSPKVIYVPRNVYVPVVKPVFVPRERVIVRPQLVHVTRPVVVDRPVPVTQRPIIIDREKPVPVPVRVAAPEVVAPTENVIREEYVYQDNLPYCYGGRTGQIAGGIDYGYMPVQEQYQYTTVSQPEPVITTVYENQGASYNAGTNQVSGGQGLIEVLDSSNNAGWQQTNSSGLLNQYGASAMELLQNSQGFKTGTFTTSEQNSCEQLLQILTGGKASHGAAY